jgi:hypothetical protein
VMMTLTSSSCSSWRHSYSRKQQCPERGSSSQASWVGDVVEGLGAGVR